MQPRKKLCLKKKPERRDASETGRLLHLSSRELAPQIQNESSRLDLPTTSPTSSSAYQKWTPLPTTKLLIESAPAEPQKDKALSNFEDGSVKKWTPLPPPNMELLTRQPVIMLKWEDSDTDVETESKMMDLEQNRNEIDPELDDASNNEPVILNFSEHKEILKSQEESNLAKEETSFQMPPPIENTAEGGRDAELFGNCEFDAFYTSVDKFMDMSSSSDEDLPSVNWMVSPSKKAKIDHHRDHASGTTDRADYKTKPYYSSDSVKSDSGFGDGNGKLMSSISRSVNTSSSVKSLPTGGENKAQLYPVYHSQSGPSTSSASESTRGGDLVTEICPMCNMKFPSKFTQCDADEHIAICLSVYCQDF